QFQTIRRERVMVLGLIVIGGGVQILTAVLLDDLAKLIWHDVFVGRGYGIFPGLFQSLQLGLVSANGLVALCNVGGISNFDLFECGLFGGVVGGSDLVGALEGHVLEHVRQAGLTHRVLCGAGIDQRE